MISCNILNVLCFGHCHRRVNDLMCIIYDNRLFLIMLSISLRINQSTFFCLSNSISLPCFFLHHLLFFASFCIYHINIDYFALEWTFRHELVLIIIQRDALQSTLLHFWIMYRFVVFSLFFSLSLLSVYMPLESLRALQLRVCDNTYIHCSLI